MLMHLNMTLVVGLLNLCESYEKRGAGILYYQIVGMYLINQLTFTCSKSTIETLEKGVKYVQS